MDVYLDVILNNYVNFKGRTRRREFWLFQLIHVAIIFAIYLFIYPATVNGNAPNIINKTATVLLVIYFALTLTPAFALNVRRFHDIGSSGWWALISFVPSLFIIVMIAGLIDSKPGTNKWGPNPKGVEAPTSAF